MNLSLKTYILLPLLYAFTNANIHVQTNIVIQVNKTIETTANAASLLVAFVS
jgi:hypothetical protein